MVELLISFALVYPTDIQHIELGRRDIGVQQIHEIQTIDRELERRYINDDIRRLQQQRQPVINIQYPYSTIQYRNVN